MRSHLQTNHETSRENASLTAERLMQKLASKNGENE